MQLLSKSVYFELVEALRSDCIKVQLSPILPRKNVDKLCTHKIGFCETAGLSSE